MRGIVVAGLLAMTVGGVASAPATPADGGKALVIAHRGASALRPEHTLAAYAKAIEDGADWIEPDLVSTKDGVLVSRHENGIGGTTDVADHPEFASRRTRKTIDGETVEGWFTEDFTLAELKTLRARERLPQLRGTAHDDRFRIATLDEIIEFAAAESAARGRIIGLVLEIKHGTYFAKLGLAMEDKLLDVLAAHEYTRRAPVAIQSFEVSNLEYLRGRLGADRGNIALVQLIGRPQDRPGDVLAAAGELRYADMMTPTGLRRIAGYADILGPEKNWVVPLDGKALGKPSALVREAHAAGLKVVPYTFRPENHFLPANLRKGDDPRVAHAEGAVAEIRVFLDAGIDGFFTDDPATGRKAVDGRLPP